MLSTVWSCPEKYRGQLTLPSGARALIILDSVPPINRHYFLSLSALLEAHRIWSLFLRMLLDPRVQFALPVAGNIGIGRHYNSTHFTES